jgi:rhodanese-related sulfurtransferase
MNPEIRAEELAARLQAGEPVYLLDVRQPEEHAYCRLPGSVLIPLPELTTRVGEVQPPAGALVVVYCHHGVRSLTGTRILRHAGLADAVSLAGGIEEWSLRIDPSVPRY